MTTKGQIDLNFGEKHRIVIINQHKISSKSKSHVNFSFWLIWHGMPHVLQ